MFNLLSTNVFLDHYPFKLEQGLAVCRGAYSVVSYVMKSDTKGCEVIVSGKFRAARAKAIKFSEGFILHSGHPAQEFIGLAVRHAKMKQGVLSAKAKIMLNHDSTGRLGSKSPLPDIITILDNDGQGRSLG
ncbi:40S ribosomal protein S3 [Coemansia sp. RSA 1933]|nr:40S ribosomal protein S3 [Coemansia sp. RSA 1933]